VGIGLGLLHICGFTDTVGPKAVDYGLFICRGQPEGEKLKMTGAIVATEGILTPKRRNVYTRIRGKYLFILYLH
jgi:hypothetical protein